MKKKINRLKRSIKSRKKNKQLKKIRLCVHRTSKHIYAQIISSDGSKTISSASTVEKKIRIYCKNKTGNIKAAIIIGKEIAKRTLKIGIKNLSFDRSGFKYHGRVKALAESARKEGLNN